jgi:hypothetical protein
MFSINPNGAISPSMMLAHKVTEPCNPPLLDGVGKVPQDQSTDELTFAGDWTDEVLKRDVSAQAVRRRLRGN